MKRKLALIAVLSGLFVNAQNWSLTGNSRTGPRTNFIGTTDTNNLVFKTNNTTRFQIADNATNYILEQQKRIEALENKMK